MFDKESYGKRRAKGESAEEKPITRTFLNKKPGDKHFASGEHVMLVRGKGYMMVSRKVMRQRNPSRAGSKAMKPRSAADRYKDSLISKGELDTAQRPPAEFRHKINPSRKSGHSFPPEMTNHDRNKWRAEARRKKFETQRLKSKEVINGRK